MATSQVVRRPLPEVLDAEQPDDVVRPPLHLFFREPHLPGAEADLLLHVAAEQLDVGVLEDEAHPLVEPLREDVVFQGLLVDDVPVEPVGPLFGIDEPVEQFQKGRLAAAVGALEHDGLSPRHVKRDIAQGDVSLIGKTDVVE